MEKLTAEQRKARTELMQIFRLRQLQGTIPMSWTFENYLTFMKQLYGVATSNL